MSIALSITRTFCQHNVQYKWFWSDLAACDGLCRGLRHVGLSEQSRWPLFDDYQRRLIFLRSCRLARSTLTDPRIPSLIVTQTAWLCRGQLISRNSYVKCLVVCHVAIMFFSKVRSNIIKTENVDLYEERLKFILIFCLGKQGGGYIFKILK